ncbi:hypothetical protein D3C71_1593640 [compost metagenome]
MGGAHRHRGNDALGAGFQGIPGATQVGRQHGDQQVRVSQGVGDHFTGIGHLRQQPGRHERGDFHMPHTGRVGGVYPAAFGGGRHDCLKALQAIAQADFVDCYCAHHGLSVSGVGPD